MSIDKKKKLHYNNKTLINFYIYIMKQKIFCMIAVVMVFFMTSCKDKVEEIALDDNYIAFSQVVDGKKLMGVKTTDGTIVIPMEYEAVTVTAGFLEAKNGSEHYLFHPDGKKVIDAPTSMIFDYDEYIVLYGDSKTYYYFKKKGVAKGPYTQADEFTPWLFVEGEQVECMTKEGDVIVSGDKVIALFSHSDQKRYFIVYHGDNVVATDAEGNEICKIDAKLLEKLPKPSWKRGENIVSITTRNPLMAFKKK